MAAQRPHEEIFDVVDENDVVIEQRTRAQVHALALRHRSIHLIVENAAGEILLQKRSMQKDSHPGMWESSVSGHLDQGETYEQAVLRETKEEIGITIRPPQRLFKLPAQEDTGWEFACVYKTISEGPFQAAPDEIDELKWFTRARLVQEIQANSDRFGSTLGMIVARVYG